MKKRRSPIERSSTPLRVVMAMAVLALTPPSSAHAGILVGGLLEGGTGARGTMSAVGGVLGFLLGVLVAVVVDRRLAGSRSFTVSRIEEHEA